MRNFLERQLELIKKYEDCAKQIRISNLDSVHITDKNEEKAILIKPEFQIRAYIKQTRFWNQKLILGYPEGFSPVRSEKYGEIIKIGYRHLTNIKLKAQETISPASDKEEQETYFVRKMNIINKSSKTVKISGKIIYQYFPEGPVSDFTYLSYKWMGRKVNLDGYSHLGKGYTSSKANNQLFYNYSGGFYLGIACLDLSRIYISNCIKDETGLGVYFSPEKEISIMPGKEINFEYAIFFGKGEENHIGHLSNALWRLNFQKGPTGYIPQTDIRDLRKKLMSTWERTALSKKHDHFSCNFVSNFFGKFPQGIYLKDQFGCGWLSSDHLKARHYYEEYILTGINKFRDYCANIIKFYTRDHFVGQSRLNFPFHTSSKMKGILPFPDRTGWGAPFDAGHIDSMVTSEMIYYFLELYESDPKLFNSNYPLDILNDVLSLQMKDGHFRRLYDEDLKPVEKFGWIDQNSGGQFWIPVLLKLKAIIGDKRAELAAEKCGEAYWQDIVSKGFFALGGCEADYPDYYDIDGYRGMLWAFLNLYKATGKRIWAERAEEIQLFGNIAMMGYNTRIKKGTFYHRLNWKPRGMVFTSFYPYPDYIRTESTATGNQSANWVAYLLMQLYDATSKLVYAKRAIACMRQGSVYRDKESFSDCPKFKPHLLYTIMENNPQMDDEAGLYEEGLAQNSFSSIYDYQLMQYEMLKNFGGISVRAEKEKRHVIGIDCADVNKFEFSSKMIKFYVRNLLSRTHKTTLKVFGLEPEVRYILEDNKTIGEYKGEDLMGDKRLPEIIFKPREEKFLKIITSVPS